MFLTKEYSDISSAMLTGYSVFTTFTVENINNKIYVKAFELHIKRLKDNSEVLFGIIPTRTEIVAQITNFLSQKLYTKQLLRIAIYPKSFSISRPSEISEVQIVVTGREYNSNKTPISLELHEMIRPLAHLKTSALFPSLQTRAISQKNGFDDALFFYENNITEGPAWNILFTKGNTVYFPDPSKKTFLEGFTQKLLKEELLKNYKNIEIITKNITKKSVLAEKFDSAFIVSSGIDVIPVRSINKIIFNNTENNLDLVKIYDNISTEIVE
ncbi:TPA: hypothetical protein EYP45_01430 [Candidatus Peregrinibacteria bacterium]|nr:hypothetical protein [Candidatus Peregrinibacteria bacterium]HIQ57710.1 aminotransferase class IV [Candidatus Gracilibacteria bacterium]